MFSKAFPLLCKQFALLLVSAGLQQVQACHSSLFHLETSGHIECIVEVITFYDKALTGVFHALGERRGFSLFLCHRAAFGGSSGFHLTGQASVQLRVVVLIQGILISHVSQHPSHGAGCTTNGESLNTLDDMLQLMYQGVQCLSLGAIAVHPDVS